jgi:hypothetical protein
MLTNTNSINDLSVCKTDCLGGTYDSSVPINNILISSYNTSNIAGSINWNYPSTTSNQLILSCDNLGDGTLYYNVNIEIINGSIISINDNDGNNLNFNY